MSDYKREALKAEIMQSLERRGCNLPMYEEMVDHYLSFADIMEDLNAKAEEIKDDVKKIKLYFAYIGEARRIERTMRDMLDWLGVSYDLRHPLDSDL